MLPGPGGNLIGKPFGIDVLLDTVSRFAPSSLTRH
jgi:hypothetical protein